MTSMSHSVDDDLYNVFNDVLSGIDETRPMDAEERLRLVIDYIQYVEEVSFVIPIHPNREFVKRLHEWCVENIRNDILIDFSVNRLMESGVLMIYKGKYFEYSLENLLDEYFIEHDMDKMVMENLSQKKDTEPKPEENVKEVTEEKVEEVVEEAESIESGEPAKEAKPDEQIESGEPVEVQG